MTTDDTREQKRIAALLSAAIIRAVYGRAPQTSTPTRTDAGTPRPDTTTEARQETDHHERDQHRNSAE